MNTTVAHGQNCTCCTRVGHVALYRPMMAAIILSVRGTGPRAAEAVDAFDAKDDYASLVLMPVTY